MTRERVVIGTGRNRVIVTAKRESGGKNGEDKRHIIITAPDHMRWTTIWKVLQKLPEHLDNESKQKKKE